jgi:hypothetical protein
MQEEILADLTQIKAMWLSLGYYSQQQKAGA